MCQSLFEEKHVDQIKPSFELRPTSVEATASLQTLLLSLDPVSLDILFTQHTREDEMKKLAAGNFELFDLSSENIAASYMDRVVVHHRSRAMDSELVMYRGNIFVEGFFREQRFTATLDKTRIPLSQFVQTEPWIEWNQAIRKFEYSTKKAGLQLIDDIESKQGANLRLYRGLSSRQAELILIVRDLRHALLDAAGRDQVAKRVLSLATEYSDFPATADYLKAASARIQNSSSHKSQKLIARDLVISHFGKGDDQTRVTAFFSTPDISVASSYGAGKNSKILASSVTSELLRRIADRGSLYVGIEYRYYEIMFRDPTAIEAFADHAELATPLPPPPIDMNDPANWHE